MSKLKSLSSTAIAVLISSFVWAQDDDSQQDPSKMPMIGGGKAVNPPN